MDVDYSTNAMIAINTDQILSGLATRSTVNPYYYSLERHIKPRYKGTQNISTEPDAPPPPPDLAFAEVLVTPPPPPPPAPIG